MALEQAIERPFGISVFGSSITRIEPDMVSLKFAVSRLAQHPKEAFRDAHNGTQNIRAFLAQSEISDVSTSRVTLSQTFRYTGNESRFVGYTAKIAFHVLLRDLERMEDVLSGVVDAGANEISSVDFQTSRLKEVRADARRRAVAAAREKAENYCAAAGLTLGPVIHIEDVNPETLRGREGHMTRDIEPDADDTQPMRAFDPGSIIVGGAVRVAFEIGR